MKYIDLKKVDLSLTSLGININQLVLYLLILGIILFAFLLFFLLAMQAFGINGSIGLIVNSLVPVGNKKNLIFLLSYTLLLSHLSSIINNI